MSYSHSKLSSRPEYLTSSDVIATLKHLGYSTQTYKALSQVPSFEKQLKTKTIAIVSVTGQKQWINRLKDILLVQPSDRTALLLQSMKPVNNVSIDSVLRDEATDRPTDDPQEQSENSNSSDSKQDVLSRIKNFGAINTKLFPQQPKPEPEQQSIPAIPDKPDRPTSLDLNSKREQKRVSWDEYSDSESDKNETHEIGVKGFKPFGHDDVTCTIEDEDTWEPFLSKHTVRFAAIPAEKSIVEVDISGDDYSITGIRIAGEPEAYFVLDCVEREPPPNVTVYSDDEDDVNEVELREKVEHERSKKMDSPPIVLTENQSTDSTCCSQVNKYLAVTHELSTQLKDMNSFTPPESFASSHNAVISKLYSEYERALGLLSSSF
ncbi:hypothetical protein [Sclerotinia sclerotiorum reovirus 1]|nr:hypothetical protein [Sclerotinia sclerotiorum reovirus 1]